MPPEVRKGQKYDKSVDIYALGIVLFEMFSTRDEFNKWYESLSLSQIEYNTPSGKHQMDKGLALAVNRMTQLPRERPTLNEILQMIN